MTATDLNLNHLQAELTRIDILIQREVERWQLAGQNPHDAFRGLHLSDDDIQNLLNRPVGLSWGQSVTLPDQKERYWTALQAKTTAYSQSLIGKAGQKQQPLRLVQLADAFGLSQFELDALLVCLAPNLDLRYERLFGYLQDDVTRRWPSVNLILNLLAPPGPDRLSYLVHFADEAPLLRYQLLQRETVETNGLTPPLLAQALQVDPTVTAWLLGHYQAPPLFKEHVILAQPQPAKVGAHLPEAISAALTQCGDQTSRPLLIFSGPDQAAQSAAMHLAAAQSGPLLLQVDLAAVVKNGAPPAEALHLALRDARLTGATLGLLGWDSGQTADDEPRLSAATLRELEHLPQLIMIAGREKWPVRGITTGRPIFWAEFPLPAYTQRLGLWRHFLASEQAGLESELTGVAGQFALPTAQIQDAARLARHLAAQDGEPLQERHLLAAARASSNSRLAQLARKITPRYCWSDLILPPNRLEILQEIVATIRNRPQVLEAWGVGRKLAASKGITILFAGPPGTGKTMAAEVIAGELGLDLYKIDLSTVVSKYIGETEKNLEKIFTEAASSNAILFFDEADAIFGKRSEVQDAHDRYANIEVSYLLQRMEAYDGVTFLATNLRANVDEAFTRRLHFAVDFPEPKVADRLRIWQTLFPPDVPQSPDLAFEILAERFKLPGGNIRNIILSAAYLAANDGEVVTMEHVMHGVRREYQKMGRLVNEADLQTDV
ncbi:MAG: ATP-binding protein [Anaerolineales bacterium]|nr:ATP-binding protein [Anaerolineales bacterium]